MDGQAEAGEKRRVQEAKRKAAAGSGTGEPTEKAPKKKLDRNQSCNEITNSECRKLVTGMRTRWLNG